MGAFRSSPILYPSHSFTAFIRVTAILLAWSTSYPVCLTVQAATTTTTVDDANSSAFTFVSAWNAITPSDPCDGCATKLDSTQVLDGTWHDGSVAGSTASFKFEGSGVTLYGVTNADQTCAITFVLDGGSPVNLDLSSIPQSPTEVYNYQFFSASGLSSGSHTLSWTIETSVSNAVALIDYAIVTSDVASSSTSSTSSSGSENTGSSVVNSGQSQAVTSSSSTSQVSLPPSSTQNNPPSGTSFSTSSNLSPTTTNGPSPTTTATNTSSSTTSNSGFTVSSSIILITIGTSVETSTMILLPSPTASGQVSTGTSAAILASQKSKTAAATIVGAVLGSVIGLALVAVIVFLLARRRRKSKQAPSSIPGLESFRYDHNLDSQLPLEKGARREILPNVTSSATPVTPASLHLGPSALLLPVRGQVRDTEESPSESTSHPQPEVPNTNTANTTNSTNSPNEPLPPSEPIQQMEQRIYMLEQMLRHADHAELALFAGSPPPY
ncbi:hypothetical protein F5876DRAFT_79375 [Lentinula aff. lateritia]|uniref:Uncharacterized protein n=1 Tax=Lentinula aff. lateritia TaxID=2804960 RepID=A0ACC1TSQ5_9AGAR|nr:hypothetical protein F5876DRAFT_79375 [Lentinula aff. lateritia]